jgi:hypothetical protein
MRLSGIMRCDTCQRRERWDDTPDGREIEVLIEGGSRRPPHHPDWERGRVALAALAGEVGPVVGTCPACGQLLLAEEVTGEVPRMRVRIDTPAGALSIHEDITGPDGTTWTREQAEAFLRETYRIPLSQSLPGDVGRSALVLSLLAPFFVAWVLAGLFVLAFLAAIYEGPQDAVMGTPGFDLTSRPAGE